VLLVAEAPGALVAIGFKWLNALIWGFSDNSTRKTQVQ
jgi:hypothetical protein